MAIRPSTLARAGFYATAVLVGALSLLPGGALPAAGYVDKIEHFVAYATLGLIGGVTARNFGDLLFTVAGLIAFGGGIELLQMLAPGRYPEVADALANAAGAFLGGSIAIALRRRRVAADAR